MANDTFLFVVSGINSLSEYDKYSDKIALTALQSINTTLRDTRAAAQKRIMREVAFSASYLSPSQKRLYVNRQATKSKLEGSILARGRPTSLARFIVGGEPKKGAGVTVQVAPGKSRYMKRAFLIHLRSGTGSIETQFNRGLAIRLAKGETLERKRNVVKLRDNLYILYGPSVAQVMLDAQGHGIAEDLTPEILDDLETNFLRLAGVNK